ncbi:MAG: DUF3788 family protein [Phycisphaerae bacterium]|nr:DUF3788 family protein [Phycisphaerae bacterium]NUQ45455.1 DUF3788 family protein [Phycisphaerae bacterium]
MPSEPRDKGAVATNTDPPDGLGAARALWDQLLARVRAELPEAQVVWKVYAGKSGRQCVIRMKDRNLAYLKPGDGCFLAGFALSDAAVALLADAKLPAEFVEEVRSSPKYQEGRPARVRVDSAATLKTAATLLDIKAADVLGAKRRRR